MSFLFSSNVDVSIHLEGQETRKKAEMKVDDTKRESYLVYYDGENVTGKVTINFKKPGSKLDHHGIKIEFIGQIELFNDKSSRQEFISLIRELANPGELSQNTSFPFEFLQVEKQFESYTGTNVRLSYFLRVTVVKRLSDIVREYPICVHTLSHYPDTNNSIKMEVGIEDCLHIEFEYSKSKYDLHDAILGKIHYLLVRVKLKQMELIYHLTDVIVGKIYFILVRLKVKHMEIQIIRKESVGSESNPLVDNEVLTKFEIMDGLPVRGESVPIRLFLSGYDLTPTMKDVNKKFSVRYFINLVLIDEEDRRYFKQQEITLFRKSDRPRKSIASQQSQQQQSQQQLQSSSSTSTIILERTSGVMSALQSVAGTAYTSSNFLVNDKDSVIDENSNSNTKHHQQRQQQPQQQQQQPQQPGQRQSNNNRKNFNNNKNDDDDDDDGGDGGDDGGSSHLDDNIIITPNDDGDGDDGDDKGSLKAGKVKYDVKKDFID